MYINNLNFRNIYFSYLNLFVVPGYLDDTVAYEDVFYRKIELTKLKEVWEAALSFLQNLIVKTLVVINTGSYLIIIYLR